MHHITVLIMRVLSPALGILLGLLGFATLGENLLGWLLFVSGIVYAAGTIIVAYILRRNAWEPEVAATESHARQGERSFWLLQTAIAVVLFLSPLEFLYLRSKELPTGWLEIAGACIAFAGGIVFAWARRNEAASYEGHLSSSQGKPVRHGGPYRFIRHPGYLGCLVAALGMALGYGSIWGCAALALLMLPAVLWRIGLEERLLSARFGAQFQEYASKTKRLIPGVW